MKFKIYAALIAVYIIWGSTYLGIKYAADTLGPFFHGAFRFSISGLVLYFWQRSKGEANPTWQEWRSAIIVGTLLLATGNGVIALAETHIPSGVASLCLATSSIMMVSIDAIFLTKKAPNIYQWLGLILGLAGVVYLIDPFKDVTTPSDLSIPFTLLGIFAAFSWAVGSMYSRKAVRPRSVLMYTGMQMIAGSVGMLLISVAMGELKGFSFANVSNESWIGVTYLIIFGSWIGFTSYGYLLKHASVQLISTYLYVNPIVAILLGSLIAKEDLSSRVYISAAIILSSIFFVNYKPKPTSDIKPLTT